MWPFNNSNNSMQYLDSYNNNWVTDPSKAHAGYITDVIDPSSKLYYDGPNGLNLANEGLGKYGYSNGVVNTNLPSAITGGAGGSPSFFDRLTGWNSTGPNGSNQFNPGVGGLALGAFNAYNAWNQGNKMYDLQKDAFNFSKEQFWDNFLMNRDKYNRLANRSNMLAESWNDATKSYANGGATPEDGAAWRDKMYNKYQVPGGEHIVSNDGRSYNIVDTPDQYKGQGYDTQAISNTVAGPGAQQANQSAFANINKNPTMDSTNPNAAQNQQAKPITVDPRKSAFNKRKIGV